MSALGHGSISGALLSVTHARVSSCRSRVSSGIAWPSTSARISSISIDGAESVELSQWFALEVNETS